MRAALALLSLVRGSEHQIQSIEYGSISLDAEVALPSLNASPPICPPSAIIVIRKQNGDVTRKCDSWSFESSRDIIARVNKWLNAIRSAQRMQ
jgi:hypothetical protein